MAGRPRGVLRRRNRLQSPLHEVCHRLLAAGQVLQAKDTLLSRPEATSSSSSGAINGEDVAGEFPDFFMNPNSPGSPSLTRDFEAGPLETGVNNAPSVLAGCYGALDKLRIRDLDYWGVDVLVSWHVRSVEMRITVP